MEGPKTQNSKYDIEREKQIWRTSMTNFKTYYKALLMRHYDISERKNKWINRTENQEILLKIVN